MELRSISSYARELRPTMAPDAFEPATSRVLWLPVHIAIIASIAYAMVHGKIPALLWPVASIVIGCCLAGITFLGHETLHGGVVRGKFAIRLVGWFGFLPFCVSPQLWMAWHNRVHHNHTNHDGIDPDMYPTLADYQSSRATQIITDHFGMGRGRITGILSLLFGLTGQSTQMMINARKRNILSPRLFRRALIEVALGVAFWTTVAVIVGFVPFIFIYVLPLLLANSIVMAFIATNHNLSPLTDVNDPLVNSLTVTMPGVFSFLTLGFGYHTEHHLFPRMSTRHAPAIAAELRRRWPDRYQSMPFTTAIAKVYRTGRVYQTNTTLLDPPSGRSWPTLGAESSEASRAA